MRPYCMILLAVCFNVIQAGPLLRKDARIPRHVIPRYTNETFLSPPVTPESASPTSSVSIPTSNEPLPSVTPTARPSTDEDKSAPSGGEGNQEGAGQSSAGVAIAPEGAIASEGDSNTASALAPNIAPSTSVSQASEPLQGSQTSASTQSTQSVLNSAGEALEGDKQQGRQTYPSTPGNAVPTTLFSTPTSNALYYATETTQMSPSSPLSATTANLDVVTSQGTSSASPAAPAVASTSESTLASSTPSMSTLVTSYFGGASSDLASATSEIAFEAFQSARSAQASGISGASSSGYQAQSTSSSPPQIATPGLTSTSQQDQITSSTGAIATAAGQLSLATGTSISSMPSAAQLQSSPTSVTLLSSVYGAVTTGASQGTTHLIASSDTTNTGLPEITLARTTAETTSPIVQVPSTLLGGVGPTTSPSESSSSGQPSSSAKPQYAYPDASAGNIAMAQGYNSVFQGLTPESPCDPSNSQQASACVDGQPGKCELTGTYALQSCKSGFSCFAVPLPGGQSGVDVGCYNPSVAHQALQNDRTGSSAASNSGQGSGTALGSSSTASATSATIILPVATSSSAVSSSLPVVAAAATGAATEPSSVVNAEAKATSAALSTPTPTSGRASLEQGMQGQNHVQAAPTQGSQPQPTSSPVSSPTSTSDANSGVQLSFPDKPGMGSTVGQDRDTKSDNANEDPPSNQKNVVQNDQQNAFSSPAIPSSPTAVTATSTPAITAAPAIGAGNANGFITVTVTQTTTMHE